MQRLISGADAPFEISWDKLGVAHVWAETVADAYRGMGYAAGYERLWQIHLSCAYANGEAAALLGERFVAQDALQRAFNVHGRLTPRPASQGYWSPVPISKVLMPMLVRWMNYRQSLPMQVPSHGYLRWMILPLVTGLLLGFSIKVGLKKYSWDALWQLMEWIIFVIMFCI